jgi:hypothetical protein
VGAHDGLGLGAGDGVHLPGVEVEDVREEHVGAEDPKIFQVLHRALARAVEVQLHGGGPVGLVQGHPRMVAVRETLRRLEQFVRTLRRSVAEAVGRRLQALDND